MTTSSKSEVRSVFIRLLGYLVPLKGVLFLSLFGLILYGLVDATFIFSIKPFIDQGFAANVSTNSLGVKGVDLGLGAGFNSDNAVLKIAPLVVIGLFILRGLANFLSTYGISYISAKMIMSMRQQVFEHYLILPVSYIEAQSSGNLISRVTYDTEQIARASGSALITIVRDGITVIGMLGVMFYNSWKLSLCILIVGPLIGLVIMVVSRKFRKVSRQIQTAMGDVTSVTEQMVKSHKNVLVFGGQKTESQRFAKVNDNNRSRTMKLALAQAISQPLIMVIGSFALAFVLYASSIDSLKADLTAGTFATILAGMLAMLQPIKNLTRVNAEFQRGIAACDTIFTLLDTPAEVDTGTIEVDRVRGHLRFDKVNFRYQSKPDLVINDISFCVEPGQTLALVGRSGSGKSTIASLITRFYSDLESGDITLDGISLRDYKLASLRHQVALVSQQVTLINDSIAANIAYACRDKVTDAEIIEAAKLANAYEFIIKMPDGIHTPVGEDGVMLSGGQRQRIAIARAILRDAPLLILDEATSALDTESEKAIQTGLDNLRQNRTSIVIAHRLSTIESADKILVIEQGRIVEQGTHSQLMEKQGSYANLYQMQFGS